MKFNQRKTAGVFYLFCFVFEVNPRTDPVLSKWSSLALSLPLSFGLSFELPAGSELFYALVVTGRFIRLEICTNQLSFTASCQCVKLSGLLWGAAWGREGGYVTGQLQRKENEFKQTWNRAPFFLLRAPAEAPLIFLDVEQQRAENDMLLHQSSLLAYCLLNVRKSFRGECRVLEFCGVSLVSRERFSAASCLCVWAYVW